jgi:tRNA threonylcarbamoyladenosine biosynthesis protein TsaB
MGTRIMAIETSHRYGSLAALIGDDGEPQLLRQVALPEDQRTAQVLAPALRELLADVSWSPRSIELVGVAVGPGSFTGLRLGVTTAKTLAYAVGANVLGVNTLAVLAAQAPHDPAPLWTIIDAQRRELFAAKFVNLGRSGVPIDCDASILAQDAWLAQLKPGDRVIGPVLNRLAPRLPAGVVALPEDQCQPTAAAVGRVAWQAWRSGRRDDLWKLAPNYYRPSYAEEKRRQTDTP